MRQMQDKLFTTYLSRHHVSEGFKVFLSWSAPSLSSPKWRIPGSGICGIQGWGWWQCLKSELQPASLCCNLIFGFVPFLLMCCNAKWWFTGHTPATPCRRCPERERYSIDYWDNGPVSRPTFLFCVCVLLHCLFLLVFVSTTWHPLSWHNSTNWHVFFFFFFFLLLLLLTITTHIRCTVKERKKENKED